MNSDQRVDLGEPDWSESNMQESLFGTIKTILNEGVKKVELVCSYKESGRA
ncbi:unnamed protein product [Brassica oleracea]